MTRNHDIYWIVRENISSLGNRMQIENEEILETACGLVEKFIEGEIISVEPLFLN
jgi:hypothetical protein